MQGHSVTFTACWAYHYCTVHDHIRYIVHKEFMCGKVMNRQRVKWGYSPLSFALWWLWNGPGLIDKGDCTKNHLNILVCVVDQLCLTCCLGVSFCIGIKLPSFVSKYKIIWISIWAWFLLLNYVRVCWTLARVKEDSLFSLQALFIWMLYRYTMIYVENRCIQHQTKVLMNGGCIILRRICMGWYYRHVTIRCNYGVPYYFKSTFKRGGHISLLWYYPTCNIIG